VLVLDAEESYGSSWASLSGTDFVHNLLNNSLEGQHNEQQQRQAHAAALHGSTADTPEPGDSAGRIAVQQQQQLAGVQGCSLYTHASLEKALDNKGLIIDLAPRVSVHIMADTNSGVALRFFVHLAIAVLCRPVLAVTAAGVSPLPNSISAFVEGKTVARAC
jgi:hypothetical protein